MRGKTEYYDNGAAVVTNKKGKVYIRFYGCEVCKGFGYTQMTDDRGKSIGIVQCRICYNKFHQKDIWKKEAQEISEALLRLEELCAELGYTVTPEMITTHPQGKRYLELIAMVQNTPDPVKIGEVSGARPPNLEPLKPATIHTDNIGSGTDVTDDGQMMWSPY